MQESAFAWLGLFDKYLTRKTWPQSGIILPALKAAIFIFPHLQGSSKKHCMDTLHISLEAGSYKAAYVSSTETSHPLPAGPGSGWTDLEA